jgi:hypothetical protein
MSYVALAVGVGSALYSGSQAKQAGQIAGIYAEGQAQLDEMHALETSKLVRKAGRRQIGAANAAYAASGVKLGEGSALAVENEMTVGVEHDAYQALLEGTNRAFAVRQGGAQAVQQGNDAMTAAVIGAVGTAGSGWATKRRQDNYPKG